MWWEGLKEKSSGRGSEERGWREFEERREVEQSRADS